MHSFISLNNGLHAAFFVFKLKEENISYVGGLRGILVSIKFINRAVLLHLLCCCWFMLQWRLKSLQEALDVFTVKKPLGFYFNINQTFRFFKTVVMVGSNYRHRNSLFVWIQKWMNEVKGRVRVRGKEKRETKSNLSLTESETAGDGLPLQS